MGGRALAALVAVIMTTVPAQAADPILRGGDRVVLMGDSEAFLLGHDLPKVIDDSTVSFAFVARPGSSVISWSQGLPDAWASVRSLRPSVLLVSLGANDSCMGPSVVVNEDRYLDRMLRRLARLGAREVIWLGPPRIGHPRGGRGSCSAARAVPGLEMFAQMVVSRKVPYFDARSVSVAMWSDFLHCSRPQYAGDPARGCLDWAEWVWKRLRGEP